MTMRRAKRQMSASAERSGVGQGEAFSDPDHHEATRSPQETKSTGPVLLIAALARENMQQAWKRVRSNKGAAGIDGLDIDQTADRLRSEWSVIREQLLSGTYRPQPVRRVTIPKPEGAQCELGIPTVTDLLIQQALPQVLQPSLIRRSPPIALSSAGPERTPDFLASQLLAIEQACAGGFGP